MSDTFPRQQARTRRFTLGAPRSFTVSADGGRVLFLRSGGGTDPVTSLRLADVESCAERLLADPQALTGGDPAGAEELTDAERARRERAREQAGGITSYAATPDGALVTFALAGRLYLVDVAAGSVRRVETAGSVFDPRPAPTGQHIAYVNGRSLEVVTRNGATVLHVGEDDQNVSWGRAEFIAAEEMGRARGFWWAPDGAALLVARIDESPVTRWWVADPAQPERAPHELRYPAAGTPNAEVSLAVWRLAGEPPVGVAWDHPGYPYLVAVDWSRDAPLTVVVQSRDQRRLQVLTVEPATGATTEVFADRDEHWVEIVPGTPRWLTGGRLVMAGDRAGSRRLLVDGSPVTPPELQLRAVVGVHQDEVVFTASTDPTQVDVWSTTRGRLTDQPGVHAADSGGGTLVLTTATLDDDRTTTSVQVGGRAVMTLTNLAETAALRTRVQLGTAGRRELRYALLHPSGWDGASPLPVLLDPYGGPHAQRVLAARSAYHTAQWFADQGFAVLVADGRGTPGRGSEWERAVAGDLATAPLDDQVDAVHAVAAEHPELDLEQVAIRGWSFGGYLAALAVLRRPDVFHAAIAGAPVTDWRRYDTHYTERYLGADATSPAYDASSLLVDAAGLERPLMLIHGLADDNVVAAHSLALSSALLAAGHLHTVLPLSGVTHMTPQEVVAENLLRLQVAFLRDALRPR